MKLVWDGMGESVFVSEIDMKDHQYCDTREHLLGYLHTVDGIVIQINAKFWVSVKYQSPIHRYVLGRGSQGGEVILAGDTFFAGLLNWYLTH